MKATALQSSHPWHRMTGSTPRWSILIMLHNEIGVKRLQRARVGAAVFWHPPSLHVPPGSLSAPSLPPFGPLPFLASALLIGAVSSSAGFTSVDRGLAERW